MPKLSIITINLNDKTGLQKTVNSVFAQTFKDVEYIVIDGDSNDGSADLIEQHKGKISKYVIEKDTGIYNAMNKGIRLSSGEYLLFLNSGDYLESTATLDKVAKHLHSYDIIYGNMIIDKDGKFTQGISPKKLEFEEMIRGTLWHPVSFIKRTLFDTYGLYKENYKIISDYEFFLRTIFVERVSTQHINEFISVFNTKGIGSSDKFKAIHDVEKYEVQTNLFHPEIIASAMRFAELKRSKSQVIHNFIKSKPLLLKLARIQYSFLKRFF